MRCRECLAALTSQLISTGCALAAYGELHFKLSGFLCQAVAVLVSAARGPYASAESVQFESSRLVSIQILLQNLKVRPWSC